MYLKRNILVAFVGLILVAAACLGLYYFMWMRIDYSTINYIKQNMKGANNFLDMAGDIDVHSIDDIGFIVKGEFQLEIHYGKQIIKVNKRCLQSEEWVEKVKRIGIEVKYHVDDETGNILYRVEYWGRPGGGMVHNNVGSIRLPTYEMELLFYA